MLKIPVPRAHHAVGALLCGASWFTLLGLIVYSLLGFQGPADKVVDLLFVVPAAFRIAGYLLLAHQGTPVAGVGMGIDLCMIVAVLGHGDGDVKGRLMVSGILASNLIPGLWSVLGGRWSGLFGMLGAVVTAICWITIETRILPGGVLVLLGTAVTLSWLADAALMWWALQIWREANLDDARSL